MANAFGPYWGYAQAEYAWPQVQPGEDGNGYMAQLSIPLGEYLYAGMSQSETRRRSTDPAIRFSEEFEANSIGLGIHTTRGQAHAYGIAGYRQRRDDLDYNSQTYHQHSYGGIFAVGFRALYRPWISLEPEIGGTDGLYLRARIALRVVPHLWLIGGYTSGAIVDTGAWSAGLRWSLADSDAPPPGARRESSEQGGAQLASGDSLVALQTLRLQVRPAAGAPETTVVPQGAKLQLLDIQQNEFGKWWRVKVGTDEGWIRESFLQ